MLARALGSILALDCNSCERYINLLKVLFYLTPSSQQPTLSSQQAEQAIASRTAPAMIVTLISVFLLLPCFIFAAVVPFTLDGKLEG
jgi:hypothetical protein